MARIQRQDGVFLFGELDDVSVSYDDTTGELVIEHATGVMIIAVGTPGPDDVTVDLKSKGFDQTFCVELFNADGDIRTVGMVVDADNAADDSFTLSALNSTASIGVVKDAIIAGGGAASGAVCVRGVCEIDLDNAAVLGEFVATAAAGLGHSQAAIPLLGRCLGIVLQATGGAGLARCLLFRMGASNVPPV